MWCKLYGAWGGTPSQMDDNICLRIQSVDVLRILSTHCLSPSPFLSVIYLQAWHDCLVGAHTLQYYLSLLQKLYRRCRNQQMYMYL